MDKKAWIVITLCIVAMFMWTSHRQEVAKKNKEAAEKTAGKKDPKGKGNGETPDPGPDKKEDPKPAGEEDPKPEITKRPEVKATLTSGSSKDDTKLMLTSRGGGISAVDFQHKHLKQLNGSDGLQLNSGSSRPIGAISRAPGETEEIDYEIIEQSEKAVIFEGRTKDNVLVRKTYSFSTDEKARGYLVDLKLELTNLGDSSISLSDFYLFAGRGSPFHWRETENFILVNWLEDGGIESEDVGFFSGGWFSSAQDLFTRTVEDFGWGGVSNQFYSTIFIPKEKHQAKIWATRSKVTLKDDEGATKALSAIEAAIGLPGGTLGAKDAPGASKVLNYRIYVGPKEYRILSKLEPDIVDVLDYGWFAFISKFLIWLMGIFHDLASSWGIAIIIITIIIRLIIWPLHHRSTRTFKRMALLNPLMKDIREKHADNPQRMNQEMMKLYKEYGVNPLGGCFPLLLQIPIFFGYFTMLRSAVELRHESFLWVADLSQPDTIGHLLGIPINPLPMLMGITMYLQMKMTPTTGDSTQQKIMMFMPLIFFFVCYTFPSALALYWTSQNIISMGQTWLTRHMPDPVLEKRVDEEKAKAAAAKSRKGTGNAPRAKKRRKR